MPATSFGVVNTTWVAVTLVTVAAAVRPTRTFAPAGTAPPVMVTFVPPAASTRVGLIDVSLNGPTDG